MGCFDRVGGEEQGLGGGLGLGMNGIALEGCPGTGAGVLILVLCIGFLVYKVRRYLGCIWFPRF